MKRKLTIQGTYRADGTTVFDNQTHADAASCDLIAGRVARALSPVAEIAATAEAPRPDREQRHDHAVDR